MRVLFQTKRCELIFTEHAKLQMELRGLDETLVVSILETGKIKLKDQTKNKFWVFKAIAGRKDNLVCLAVSLESPRLIVITAMINWSPT